MQREKFTTLVLFVAALILASPLAAISADDPLNAFPTMENTVEERVKRLTEGELKEIEVPEDADTVVFSIATGPASVERSPRTVEVEPWLRVFADGTIDCGNVLPLPGKRSTDTLTKPELTWLLHLAANECVILDRTTSRIDAAYQQRGAKLVANGEPQNYYLYRMQLSSKSNDLMIPERALVVRPLRTRLKLVAFASLNKYANHLVSRAHFGAPDERQSLLEQLNEELEAEYPDVPQFRMEHLGAAVNIQGSDLSAVFRQEIELGENRFKRVMGMVQRKEKGSEPVFSINAMEYTKYQP
jgi:hypothetical protein